ncbi:uncharacterized protein LOC124640200 [Helicoverpa zea]|uniref:Uncharacterized protein n=1 Tax=Helicoverpa armigera TaxID=29058 RepID=A0A2W1B924_HELAM|nr:uncharacterized protein LOC110382637 [Helicoverpa armigera]XP_047033826.1 uncharacterized protein LOC124640200 [Helicoverpa zea]PZC71331.1 hypothetical protein B5X24_HaOG213605 [Helicoverpa armigera]
MKSCILVALLAALASCVHAAAVPTNAPTVVGAVQPGDWLMTLGTTTSVAQPDYVITKRLRYTLGSMYQVNAVIITEQGVPQGGAPAFVGGLGTNDITVVLVSARGRGLHYRIELWGYDTTGADLGPDRPQITIAEF